MEVARDDPDPSTRSAALRALTRRDGDESVFQSLTSEALDSDALSVRLAAVTVLSDRVEHEWARTTLARIMLEGSGPDSVRAAVILARWGDEGAMQRLQLALGEGGAIVASTIAIGAPGLEAGIRSALLRALEHEEPEVRLQVAATLLATDDRERAASELGQLLDQPGWIGARAAIALARVGDDAAYGRLSTSLGDPDSELRAYVVTAAGLIPGALALARPGLSDEDGTVRVAAAAAVLRLLAREG